jgi:hypothetical protein
MAIAAKCCFGKDKGVSLRAMDAIGLTVSPPSSVPLPISAANQQSLMVKPLSRTVTVRLTSKP